MPLRALLDENLPERLRHSFGNSIEAVTVRFQGWSGKRNGELLCAAEQAGFDVVLTVDQGIPYEQDLGRLTLGVILIHTRSNQMIDLEPRAREMRDAILKIKPGQLIHLWL